MRVRLPPETALPLRVLMVISSLRGGGAERVLSVLANEFTRAGHAVRLVTFSAREEGEYPLLVDVERVALGIGIGAVGVLPSIGRNVRRILGVRGEVLSFRPDVVLSFMDGGNLVALLAGTLSGVPVAISERVDPAKYPRSRSWRALRRLLYPLARGVIVQTRSVADGWAARFLDRRRVHVLPNPLAITPVEEPLPRRSRALRILAAGRLDAQKGFDVLLEAFGILAPSHPELVLVIAGEGRERDSLERQARELGLATRVHLPGHVRDLSEMMRQSVAFVLSSRFEGFPNVMIEALASGTPVVSTDCDSGPRQILGDTACGILVPVNDAAAMAEAIRQVLEAGDYDSRAAASASLASEYSSVIVAGRWIEALRRAIAMSARGS